MAITGPVPATFGYDGTGHRSRKIINGTVTDFVYDGLNPVRQLQGAAAVDLLTGLGIDEYFTRTDAGGTVGLLVDALGSTAALSDASGAIQTQYTYEAFGAATVAGAPSGNDMQFTGRENDATGLYYYRARYYHPGLQRFVAEDPIGFHGRDFNLYVYVRNSPTRWRDPLGWAPGDSYPTPGAAGREAGCYYIDWSMKMEVEFGGYVYRKADGSYSYSPHQEGSTNEVFIVYPLDGSVVGTYHTHPLPSHVEGPSRRDVDEAQRTGLTFYIVTSSKRAFVQSPTGRKDRAEQAPCGTASHVK